MNQNPIRKIIHVDMDCFYAAVEIRDNPSLADKPVAVGGSAEGRGVLCTSNYIARQYGVRSAMPTGLALKLCKDLVLLPVNIAKYKEVAKRIHQIFKEYTDLVEPLSLDEAYLDVTNSSIQQGSATLIAQEIRKKIRETEYLTASAGVAPNKFLAKIASGWKKPNGLFVIKPSAVEQFVLNLPVEELFGVGKVTAKHLHGLGIKNCADLQKLSIAELKSNFGKLGQNLYEQCRGRDHRQIIPNRERKSLSVEHTFSQDISNYAICREYIKILCEELIGRLAKIKPNKAIKNQFIKIKLCNFKQISVELSSNEINLDLFISMFSEAYAKIAMPLRLLGVGVHFHEKKFNDFYQESLFEKFY